MADNNRRLGILLEVADRFTSPFRRMSAAVEGMTAPLNRARAAMARFANASGITRISASVGALGARIGALGAAAKATAGKMALLTGGGALAAMWSFNRLFIQPAANAEQLVLGLRNVTGGAEAAQAEFKRLSAFADGSAQDIAEVADAYKAIRVAGGQVSDAMLAKLGDVAAGTKKSYADIGEAIGGLMRGDAGAASSIDPTIQVKDIGNKMLFAWTENGKKMYVAVAKQNKQLLAETMAALWSKKHAGAMDQYGQTWDGMLGRVKAVWTKFQRMVMESGAFTALREKLAAIVAKVEEWAENGQLQEWAERVSAELVKLFDKLQEGFDLAWSWAQKMADKVGGWSNLLLIGLGAVVAVMTGPLLLALALVGKAVIALGMTIMATPLGWFLAACAAIAGLAYIVWDQWEPIKQYFIDLWADVKAAFDRGWIEGIWTAIAKFNPLKLIQDGIVNLIGYLTGVDLYAEGEQLFTGLWDGVKSIWGQITAWVEGAWRQITGFLPDFIKDRLGLTVDANVTATPDLTTAATAPAQTAGQIAPTPNAGAGGHAQGDNSGQAFNPSVSVQSPGRPTPSSSTATPPLNDRIAAAIAQASESVRASLEAAGVKSELVIRAIVPPSFQIEGQTSQGTLRIERQSLGPIM